MGGHEGWPLPNGLLPNDSDSAIRVLDVERWSKAEERIAELIGCIQPNQPSEERRNAVADYVQRLIMKCFPCQVKLLPIKCLIASCFFLFCSRLICQLSQIFLSFQCQYMQWWQCSKVHCPISFHSQCSNTPMLRKYALCQTLFIFIWVVQSMCFISQ